MTRPGFTLFEAVLALMIIGVVAISTLTTVGAQLRAQARGKQIAEVEALAQDRFAVLRLLTAEQLRSLPDTVARGRFPPPLQRYTWAAMSTPVWGEEFLSEVAVAISWSDGTYTLRSRVYQPPRPLTVQAGGAAQ